MTPQWMKLIANLFSLARLLGWLTAWSPAALLIGAALWISSRAHAQETSPVWCSAAFVEATNANRKPPGETLGPKAHPCKSAR